MFYNMNKDDDLLALLGNVGSKWIRVAVLNKKLLSLFSSTSRIVFFVLLQLSAILIFYRSTLSPVEQLEENARSENN